jgi:hypothetical protein
MSRQTYRYFTIPLASVPKNPTYRVWFSTWLANRSEYIWSEKRPDPSDPTTTWVVGATDNGDVPADATVIIQDSIKCIPPPPLALPSNATSPADFQTALTKRLTQQLEDTRSL